jgi:hypothetical protein
MHPIAAPGDEQDVATKEDSGREASLDGYPNPFNPTTQLHFALPDGGNVSLIIYDILGRQVAALANGFYGAGTYDVTWNASLAASGVYFARLTLHDSQGKLKFNKVNKLLLMK